MSSRLITERTVREAAISGKEIDLPDEVIVTPAARDLARQLGVPLRRRTTSPTTELNEQRSEKYRVVLGSDHGGYALKEALKPVVSRLGFEVTDVGCGSTDPVDYPVFAARVADAVARGEALLGIMIDGAGIGSAMVANKIPGVRAASCYDLTTAKNAREHNNANVLTLGGGLIGERLAGEIAGVFLMTPFAGGRHAPRVAMIDALDR